MTGTEQPHSDVAAFRNYRWKTRWLVVGITFLLVWCSLRFVDRQWWLEFPTWLMLLLTGMLPQIVLLLFPILTRERNGGGMISFPGVRRCLLESAIAIPIAIGTILAVGGLTYIASQLAPDTSLTPEAISNMVTSPDSSSVYFILVFSFTFAPFAEEVFFRGFLYNVLRRRMPRFLAVILESLIFGFGHFFGSIHGVVATVLGLVLTLVYEWRKTLITPICVHAGINCIWAASMLFLMTEHGNKPVIGVFGSAEQPGCLVREVSTGSAADEGGIEVGDIIDRIDGQPVADYAELSAIVASHQVGDTVALAIRRAESSMEIEVTLKRRGTQTRVPEDIQRGLDSE